MSQNENKAGQVAKNFAKDASIRIVRKFVITGIVAAIAFVYVFFIK